MDSESYDSITVPIRKLAQAGPHWPGFCGIVEGSTKDNPMTIPSDKLDSLIENHVYQIVSNMSPKELENIVYDMMCENLSIQSEKDILDNVAQYYEEEGYIQMLEYVGIDSKEYPYAE